MKAKHKNGPARHTIPYVLGRSKHPTTGIEEEICLSYDYVGPEPTSKTGWRCFKVADVKEIKDSEKRTPDPLPQLVMSRQNCVMDIVVHRTS